MAYEKFSLGKFAGRRIFEILLGLGYDMKTAQRLCDKGRVLDSDGMLMAKNSVANGEIFLIDYKCEPVGLRPIFETGEFAVFDKPSGVLSHPNGRNCKYSLYDEIWSLYGRSAAVVHRLDKETSGVILVAKNLASLNSLKTLFENRAVKKSYFALVSGRVENDFIIDKPISESLETDEVAIKMRICENGKKAITEIYPIEYFREFNATLVRAVPLTGRQHQIRLHLFHVKHKILGDPLYGTDTATFEAILDEKLSVCERINLTGASRLCLHAVNLSFEFNGKIYNINTKSDFKGEFINSLNLVNFEIKEINPKENLENLLEIWESSVRATHDFLSESEILRIKEQVCAMFESLNLLTCAFLGGEIVAFMVCENEKIEALFVKPKYFRQGIGKMLVKYAIKELNSKFVDVNEQNPRAFEFYKKMGFCEFSRSQTDEARNPYPIIHLKLK